MCTTIYRRNWRVCRALRLPWIGWLLRRCIIFSSARFYLAGQKQIFLNLIDRPLMFLFFRWHVLTASIIRGTHTLSIPCNNLVSIAWILIQMIIYLIWDNIGLPLSICILHVLVHLLRPFIVQLLFFDFALKGPCGLTRLMNLIRLNTDAIWPLHVPPGQLPWWLFHYHLLISPGAFCHFWLFPWLITTSVVFPGPSLLMLFVFDTFGKVAAVWTIFICIVHLLVTLIIPSIRAADRL